MVVMLTCTSSSLVYLVGSSEHITLFAIPSFTGKSAKVEKSIKQQKMIPLPLQASDCRGTLSWAAVPLGLPSTGRACCVGQWSRSTPRYTQCTPVARLVEIVMKPCLLLGSSTAQGWSVCSQWGLYRGCSLPPPASIFKITHDTVPPTVFLKSLLIVLPSDTESHLRNALFEILP